ncbi:Matrixin [Popillia japonica]|uniref:Matrixin n=1 Tax=Popillia japonica TaxID=7064 RepID=A0AAW1JKP8_POPJA
MPTKEVVSYLAKYGYMSAGDGGLRGALMRFQSFMGLPVTGVMDKRCEEVMKMPRCGLPDMVKPYRMGRRHKRFAVQRSRWSQTNLTYKIVRYSKKLKRDVVDRDVKEAFDLWGRHLNKTFTQKTVGLADTDLGFYVGFDLWGRHLNKTFTQKTVGLADTDLGFYVGRHSDEAPFDGPGEVYAHAFFPIFGGDIHFDESERWTSNEKGGVNFKQVVIHEVGHSIGLRHSRHANAVMYPMYKNTQDRPELTEDDLRGIRWLYRQRRT